MEFTRTSRSTTGSADFLGGSRQKIFSRRSEDRGRKALKLSLDKTSVLGLHVINLSCLSPRFSRRISSLLLGSALALFYCSSSSPPSPPPSVCLSLAPAVFCLSGVHSHRCVCTSRACLRDTSGLCLSVETRPSVFPVLSRSRVVSVDVCLAGQKMVRDVPRVEGLSVCVPSDSSSSLSGVASASESPPRPGASADRLHARHPLRCIWLVSSSSSSSSTRTSSSSLTPRQPDVVEEKSENEEQVAEEEEEEDSPPEGSDAHWVCRWPLGGGRSASTSFSVRLFGSKSSLSSRFKLRRRVCPVYLHDAFFFSGPSSCLSSSFLPSFSLAVWLQTGELLSEHEFASSRAFELCVYGGALWGRGGRDAYKAQLC